MTFEITRGTREPDVVFLHGTFDLWAARTLADMTRDLLSRASARLVLDLSQLTVLNGPGIAAMFRLRTLAKDRNVSLSLRNPTARVRRALEVSGADQVFTVETGTQMADDDDVTPSEEPHPVFKSPALPSQAGHLSSPTLPVPRRSGKGFIMSFGDDRICSAAGCSTLLSRYNPAHVCANHGRRQQTSI